MAMKFQYNKTFLQQLNKELKVRLNALPTLQAKESALRVEVKKAKRIVADLEKQVKKLEEDIAPTFRLWTEFPDNLVSISYIDVDFKKIAGVQTPIFRGVDIGVSPFSMFNAPPWLPAGIHLLKQFVSLRIEKEIARENVAILEYARKKTTQKVNLYEKVQIPAYEEGIRKIKRFLEDEENLAKSSQKILKTRLAQAEVAS